MVYLCYHVKRTYKLTVWISFCNTFDGLLNLLYLFKIYSAYSFPVQMPE